jgi:hypothetical protein
VCHHGVTRDLGHCGHKNLSLAISWLNFLPTARSIEMSTLDAELNDFGAQLAMLGGHAADRDG